MSAVAKSYWRSIRRGVRAFSAVPEAMRDPVRELARADVESGALARGQYRELIGEDFMAVPHAGA